MAAGGTGAWDAFPEVDTAAIATGFGCEAHTIGTRDELDATLEKVAPTLRTRTSPLLLQLDVV
ncbi:MAG TPA: hypothetical protein VL551_20105 [Actinospica sp.]|nr:hypothetical protein [Actinospica sp.]